MSESKIKICGKDYDIWATSAEVEELNNQGNAALGKELSSGKQLIAQAINNAGGTASEDESLAELAQDIEQMPIVNVSAFKFSEVPNLAKQIAEQTYTTQLGEDFRTKLTEINDVNGDITSVGAYAFQSCNNLVKINLPNVTNIGGYAFNNCTNLESVYLPNCTSVGLSVFSRALKFCKKLYIPKATVISTYALTTVGQEDSQLEEIYLDSMATHPNVFMYSTSYYRFISLKLLSLKQDFDSDINACAGNWTASTYLVNSADQWGNHLALYTNLLEYTLKRLYDHSQDGVTRTFRFGFYATLFADSQLNTEPYGSYYTPLIKAAAQACIDEATRKGWTLSA